MAILSFLVHLAGATMLLLFAVRLVRTGIERSFGASFRRAMTERHSLVQSGAMGVGLALVLQSSAAVAVLTAGFAAGGYVAFPPALAMVLGADLGSALIIQILSFDLEWLVPVLLAVGGYLFVKTEGRAWRQAGRILMGIAFILIALRFLREAMDPIRDSAFLPAVAGYLERDFVTAFIVGAVLGFVMHSSVAAILMCVTLVQIGAIPFVAGLSLVLGANMGSPLIPVWLARGMGVAARRILWANFTIRGGGAVLALLAGNWALRQGLLAADQGAQMLVVAHIAFNGMLLLVGLVLCRPAERVMVGLLPDPALVSTDGAVADTPGSALDPRDLDTPQRALPALKRELLRMTDVVERMFRPALDLYRSGDKAQIAAVRALDAQVNDGLSGIREFVASIPADTFGKKNLKTARDMMEYAVRLEIAGDVVAKRMCALAGEMRDQGCAFSKEGWGELVSMHDQIMEALRLASNVLISDDLESARLLSLEKTDIKQAELRSRKRHYRRLQSGQEKSLESSDIHLETLRAMREFNSHIASVAYPILYKNGQLLETRLIDEMPKKEAGEEA